ncbi:hypothetical protein M409DRAFT_29301 [Zasmidium cellare ATCC 36951]|uniref:Uncharacterized protein n=1 Tax=Zasmidium cellare ATCC 36951 TaxID=1080233 RepID=A0A6A6C495_ZASCE|nr:uncharacterized protein M409DRAFT_29301 [Zasmidium cellare ATCC 36951]KAF2160216.1 hypothetical protein M409DRAFT_29301 [Zasmidium cellare ATCC 36951]
MPQQQFEETETKQPYGPLMSNAIFATKWTDKLCAFLFSRYFQPRDRIDAVWMSDFAKEGFAYVANFHSQASSHSLSPADFPESSSLALDSSPCRLEDLKTHMTNPFECAAQTTVLVDVFLQKLQAMKTQGTKIFGTPWQVLPLGTRESLNETFQGVEDAKEMGWWLASDEDCKVMAGQLKTDEM